MDCSSSDPAIAAFCEQQVLHMPGLDGVLHLRDGLAAFKHALRAINCLLWLLIPANEAPYRPS